MKAIEIHTPGLLSKISPLLPASKSESNRVLILEALSEKKSSLENLSVANDTVIMQRLLDQQESPFNAEDAGTVMRFMAAYLAVTTKQQVVLTGTPRMKKRPIGILVDALRKLGAIVEYEEENGFPPLLIYPFEKQSEQHIKIKGNVSSQYISALLMIAPRLPLGLNVEIIPPIGSQPYIDMTFSFLFKMHSKFV